MLERRARGQLEFFVCGSLRDLIPDDHVLARIDRVLDLGWLHDEVARSMRWASADLASSPKPPCG